MIVKMKKVTVLISESDRDAALLKLRDLGVIHLEAVKQPASDELSSIETHLSHTDKAIQLIGNPPAGPDATGAADASRIVSEIVELSRKKEFLLRELAEYQKQNRWFEDWGAVSLESLELLRGAGLDIRFHIAPKKRLNDLPDSGRILVAGRRESLLFLVHLADTDTPRLDLPEDPMPPVEAAPMRSRMAEIEAAVSEIDAAIDKKSVHAGDLHANRRRLLTQQEFARAKYGMGEAEAVAYLQGYCPAEALEPVKRAADTEGWAWVIQDPEDPRDVPTLIRTPRWVRMIRPVFAFMGTVPGYTEFDISFWFLLFFSLFYAMLVGDAGYGIIFLVATLIARMRLPKAPKEAFTLMYVLSTATIVWGALTGTWFGVSTIFDVPALAFLEKLVIQPIASVGGDQNFMMHLCFFIGAVHLTIAHSLIAGRALGTLNALAQLGWIAIIWGLFFVAGKLVLSIDLPVIAMPLLIAGLALVLFFENYQKRMFLKGALTTLANLPLSAISAFSDVVSYLRLFAVGFATFIVADSFNKMVAGSAEGIAGTLIAALILFIGHTINIILAIMAVVVHGIRLNMLEFSGHLNMQWSGKAYQPFAARDTES